MLTIIEIYKGIEIANDTDSKKFPIATIQKDVPILGVLINGHATVEDAKRFIDIVTKQTK